MVTTKTTYTITLCYLNVLEEFVAMPLVRPQVANILRNLQELGIELTQEDMKKVTQRVIELGDKKETVTTEDLPYIISDVLKNHNTEEQIKLLNYSLTLVRQMKPVASIRIQIGSDTYSETSVETDSMMPL